MRSYFVFCVSGDEHAARLNIALKYLKKFTRREIRVIASDVSIAVDHDQVIPLAPVRGMTTLQSILIQKAALPLLFDTRNAIGCYLDSDVVAVSRRVNEVFSHYKPPITFAADHVSIDKFSRWAVHCSCNSSTCRCLRLAIRQKFGVTIPDGRWRHWNGGVFLFSEASREFSRLWLSYLFMTFDDPVWKVRDQGALAAATVRCRLRRHARLPREFNLILDPFRNQAVSDRRPGDVKRYATRENRLRSRELERSAFLHFINGGIGKDGWECWDQVKTFVEGGRGGR